MQHLKHIYVSDSVTWYQHNGWYTRQNTELNPTVYVGRNSHGSYDNPCHSYTFPWHQVIYLNSHGSCDNPCHSYSFPWHQVIYLNSYGSYDNPCHCHSYSFPWHQVIYLNSHGSYTTIPAIPTPSPGIR
jgi:hypothetical protein